jgi:hypothetical protein
MPNTATDYLRVSGQITTYPLTTTAIMVDFRGSSRVMLRVSGDDIRISYNEAMNTDSTFIMADGTNAILDPPNLMGDSVFIRADSGTCNLHIWKQGVRL